MRSKEKQPNMSVLTQALQIERDGGENGAP